AILDCCDTLGDFPMIGRARDDLRPGLPTVGYRRRAVIAFALQTATVEVHGIYHRGQEYESLHRTGPLIRLSSITRSRCRPWGGRCRPARSGSWPPSPSRSRPAGFCSCTVTIERRSAPETGLPTAARP